MTVRELIAELRHYDGDMPVVVSIGMEESDNVSVEESDGAVVVEG